MSAFAQPILSSNSIENIRDHHTVDQIVPPKYSLPGCVLDGQEFDPKVHLQLEPPSFVKDLNFKDIPFPYSEEQSKINRGIAYSQPFRVLSDDGVQAARKCISKHQEHMSQSDDRRARCVRGLGFVSNYHRSLAHSQELLDLFDEITRDKLSPHSFTSNIAHTNIGELATGKPVDKWHTDSVDYVLVVVLSDTTDMDGGDLKVLQLPNARENGEDNTFNKLQETGIPADLVETVKYTAAGYGILMQGCKILHTVTEVLQAREPRISLVNSYMTRQVFYPDTTRHSCFKLDGHVLDLEYAKHKAWRARGQLEYIMDKADMTTDKESLADILKNAAAELLQAVGALEGEVVDEYSWVDEK